MPTALLNGGDSHPINMQGLELILPEVQVKELLRAVPSNVQVLTHTEGHAFDWSLSACVGWPNYLRWDMIAEINE